MSDRRDTPPSIGELLNNLAGRWRRVDLRLIDEIRQLWPTIVDPVLAEHCQPQFIKSGVLLISVPSGAFAQRINAESALILRGFATLGDRAPRSVRPVLAQP